MGCVHGKCFGRLGTDSHRRCRRHRHRRRLDLGGSYGSHRSHVVTDGSIDVALVPSCNSSLEYAAFTQRGYYPDSPDKENQDSFSIKTQLQGNQDLHFFGVYDGHGQFGMQCSNFVRDRVVEILSKDPALTGDPVKAFNSAFAAANSELRDSEIDDSMSGTTAITVLVYKDTIYVANVGDSRAVMGVRNGNKILAENLSWDQTPFRRDEYERVKLCGARILSVDQVEGLKDPAIQSWGDEETEGCDPPRLWVQNGMYPGTAFTRSVGDSTAEMIGVIAEPEVSTVQLTPDHQFFIVASDGVFEFLSSQEVVDMVARYKDPRDACAFIAGESYKLWLEHETRTDDITIIVVCIKDLANSGDSTSTGISGNKINPPVLRTGSEVHHSVRNGYPDMQSCQHIISKDGNQAIVTPSTHLSPLEK